MLTDLELIGIHVRALFTHDESSRLLFVNEPDGPGAPAPRLFLGRTRQGAISRFRSDLPEDLVQELASLCSVEPLVNPEINEPPRSIERYVELLAKHAPVGEVSAGPAYYFPENIEPLGPTTNITEDAAGWLAGGFEEMVAELPAWQPFVAVIQAGRAVSICRSARITPEAHEAGVETLPDFRGKGYAGNVSAAWARQVLAAGAVPLYSTSWENKASQSVARKLGLTCYGTDFQIF
jgi:hypothetical protein